MTVLMGSSDWMNRNLHSRIEVCATINDLICRRELVDYFEIQWRDNDKAVRLLSNMAHEQVRTGNERHNAQKEIFQYLEERL